MNRLIQKSTNAARRKYRVRSKIVGTSKRPRLTVFVSNLNLTAQIVDDSSGQTLVHLTTVGQKDVGNTKTEKAIWLGASLAKKAKVAKVSNVVFDRNSKLFHGRVKAFADAARTEGLKF
ncbi:MAG TPA: 50S ribosomal protein L18 [Candidatus Saccharimonadales bacterium]|nr:50S ribosomal protein L18 [Candidatus Saccharimonadales bacterium]